MTSTAVPSAASRWSQPSLDELGRGLHDTTFTVVDLETTGGSAAAGCMITEVGAVKVRGGEVLGEFQTLVNPQAAIPPFIAVLTGISDTMVADAPRIDSVLPAFLDFARGTVLVAHNAPFDVGFLKHFAAQLGHAWPAFEVVDTARTARRVLTRDEAPDCKLGTLARVLHASTTPNHRALADARATVDVLHALLARLGNLGVTTLEELSTFSARVTTAQRRKRHLADALPREPGVYLFRGDHDEVLYVGTSRDLRSRVRTYFTASETRSRMGEMVGLATRVDHVVCSTALEAQVRELRLIHGHTPRYNRRSRRPDAVSWLKLTDEPWPRLSIVREVRDDAAQYVGPFRRRRTAEQAAVAFHDAFQVRQCSTRIARRPRGTACVLAEMGRCLSPCDGSVQPDVYAIEVDRLRTALVSDASEVVEAAYAQMARLADGERYEDAATRRDRLSAAVRAAARTQRLAAVTRLPELVAARRSETSDGRVRWEVHVVRHGRLAAAGVIPPGADARAWVATLRSTAETVVAGHGPAPAASVEESELVLRWLESEGVRLVHVDGDWTCPVRGAGRHLADLDLGDRGRDAVVPFDERRRDLRTEHRPAR